MDYSVAQCQEMLEQLRQGHLVVANKSTFQVQMPDGAFYTFTNPARLNSAITFWRQQLALARKREGDNSRASYRIRG